MRRLASLATIAVLLAGCGGGGSTPSAPPVTTSAPANVTPQANAHASLTIKFPPAVAVARKTTASKGRAPAATRKPQYINPTSGYTLVVEVNGVAINDPANPGNAYFTIGGNNPDGSMTLNVPITSGTYNVGAIQVIEYDGAGTGNVLAYGNNQAYTDPVSGNQDSGVLTVSPGGTASLQITMAMNLGGIAITSDGTAGSDAIVLTQGQGETSFCPSDSGYNDIYVFAADLANTFVLPGVPSGYGGGDYNNPYPGTPSVVLSQQYSDNGGTSKLVNNGSSPYGYSLYFDANHDNINATFYAYNPLAQLYFTSVPDTISYSDYVYGYAYIESSYNCG